MNSTKMSKLLFIGVFGAIGWALSFGPNVAFAAEADAGVTADSQCAAILAARGKSDNDDRSAHFDPAAIGRGDRVKLSFYELLQPQDDKWGADRKRMQEPAKGIQLRAELSKEYLVRDDGSVSIPILGSFKADRRIPAELQKEMECAFDDFLGHKGFVDITDVVKRPIYVVGKVKNSGNFEYSSGMTVLQSVALAGGFDNPLVESWQIAELSRGSQRVQEALESASRMIARSVAIESTENDKPAEIPSELVGLAGPSEAAARVNEELAPRKLARRAFSDDEKALTASVEAAQLDLDLRNQRMPIIQQSIDMRQERVSALSKLFDQHSLPRLVVQQAQSELMDAEDRRQDTLMSIGVAKDHLNKVQQELLTRRTQVSITDKKDLLDARLEAGRALSEGESAIAVMKSVTAAALASPGAQGLRFFIIRRGKDGPSMIRASETTQLEPGDVVQVKNAGPGSEPGSEADAVVAN